jgi:Zn-finger nucleic acid-binding protein
MATCPVCLKNMHIFYCFEIELDTCRYCGGLWFDGGEIEKLSALKNIPRRITHSVAYDFSQRKVEEGNRTCPRCDMAMTVKDYNGVSIDVCAECNGMWFDRYELGKAIGITDGMPKKDFDFEHFETDTREYNEIVAEGERKAAKSIICEDSMESAFDSPKEAVTFGLAETAINLIFSFLGTKK